MQEVFGDHDQVRAGLQSKVQISERKNSLSPLCKHEGVGRRRLKNLTSEHLGAPVLRGIYLRPLISCESKGVHACGSTPRSKPF